MYKVQIHKIDLFLISPTPFHGIQTAHARHFNFSPFSESEPL